MRKKFAQIISLVLNPFFLILILILLGIEKSNLSQVKMMLFTVSALLLNGIFPTYLVVYFTQKGRVIDDVLANREVLKNRPFILAWTTIILMVETLTLYFFKNPQPLFTILITTFSLSLVLFLITLSRKISLHTAFIASFSLIILFSFGLSFWPILISIPIVIWSRLALKRHTKKQIAGAFVLGLCITSLVFYLYGLIPYSPAS